MPTIGFVNSMNTSDSFGSSSQTHAPPAYCTINLANDAQTNSNPPLYNELDDKNVKANTIIRLNNGQRKELTKIN